MERQVRLSRWLALAALTWTASFYALYAWTSPGRYPAALEFLLLTFALPVALASVATFLFFRLPPEHQRKAWIAPLALSLLLLAPMVWLLAFVLSMSGAGNV